MFVEGRVSYYRQCEINRGDLMPPLRIEVVNLKEKKSGNTRNLSLTFRTKNSDWDLCGADAAEEAADEIESLFTPDFQMRPPPIDGIVQIWRKQAGEMRNLTSKNVEQRDH
jgi:hypothetical protein